MTSMQTLRPIPKQHLKLDSKKSIKALLAEIAQ